MCPRFYIWKPKHPWGEERPDAKRALFNAQTGAGPAAQFPANGFGLHDMAGSMSGWTADWFEREYYKSSPEKNPEGPDRGQYKVIRGGAWSDLGARITVFFRNWVRPNQKTPNLGLALENKRQSQPTNCHLQRRLKASG